MGSRTGKTSRYFSLLANAAHHRHSNNNGYCECLTNPGSTATSTTGASARPSQTKYRRHGEPVRPGAQERLNTRWNYPGIGIGKALGAGCE
jgi:hypothetical protein